MKITLIEIGSGIGSATRSTTVTDKLLSAAWLINGNSLWAKWVILLQAPVVQRLDSAIHPINHYPVDKN